jgi:hypothetical protein
MRADTIDRSGLPGLLVLNTTNLSAEQAADAIIGHLRKIEASWLYAC